MKNITVTVSGSAGVGKTAVLREIEEHLTNKGFTVDVKDLEMAIDNCPTRIEHNQRLNAVMCKSNILIEERQTPRRNLLDE